MNLKIIALLLLSCGIAEANRAVVIIRLTGYVRNSTVATFKDNGEVAVTGNNCFTSTIQTYGENTYHEVVVC